MRCDAVSLVTLMQPRFIADDYARIERIYGGGGGGGCVAYTHTHGSPSATRDISDCCCCSLRLTGSLTLSLYQARIDYANYAPLYGRCGGVGGTTPLECQSIYAFDCTYLYIAYRIYISSVAYLLYLRCVYIHIYIYYIYTFIIRHDDCYFEYSIWINRCNLDISHTICS